MTKTSTLTQLLSDYSGGRSEALGELIPLVQRELHRLAEGYLRKERPDHTLQPTALVNEAFVTLMNQKTILFQNRAHFFAVAALAMRQVLVTYARKHNAEKRGGGWRRVTLDDRAAGNLAHAGADVLALDRALERLSQENERQAKIVELRYFGGLTVEETATVLQISPRTVKREWMVARAWLLRQLAGDADAEP